MMFLIRQGAASSGSSRHDSLFLTKELPRFINAASTDRNTRSISTMTQENHSKSQLPNLKLFGKKYQGWLTQVKYSSSIRALSTVEKPWLKPIELTLLNKKQSNEFMAVFTDIVEEITNADDYQHLPKVAERIRQVLQYTIPNGKRSRGLTTIMSYQLFEKPELLTPENIRLAQILGWCIEIVNGLFLFSDDVMDRSETRRGIPCWYRLPGVGLTAFTDTVIMENIIFVLLTKHLKNHPSYIPILELYHHTILKTAIGQAIDFECCDEDGKLRLDSFTMDRFSKISEYKTSLYSYYTPVGLGMYLAKIYDKEKHKPMEIISLEIGELFQIQNDFLDCFGDPSVTGKIGTDIQEGKCCWFSVVALQKCTPAQRKIMDEHYGRYEPESVALIRQLYEDLDLLNAYVKYETECYNMIKSHIHQIPKELHPEIYIKLLDSVYKRNH